MPPRPTPSERQPLLGVQPIDPLVVHPPPLPPQEHMQLLVTGTQAHTGEFPQPRPERLLRGPAAPVADHGSLDPHGPAGPALGHLVRLPRPVHERAAGGGPYHFF